MARAYDERETVFAGVMDDRRAWEQATAGQRRMAVAADAELRCRHPRQRFRPLRSAEPEPISDTQRDALVLTAGDSIPAVDPWIQKLSADRAVFAEQLAHRQDQLRADLSPDGNGSGPWRMFSPESAKQPLLQPPRPAIQPSARVLERVREREADLEAAT
jgi:hypothetical protein